MAERKAVTNQMARRYARARKGEKGRILDRLCAPHRLGPPAMIGEGEDHHRPRGRPLEPIQRFLRPGHEIGLTHGASSRDSPWRPDRPSRLPGAGCIWHRPERGSTGRGCRAVLRPGDLRSSPCGLCTSGTSAWWPAGLCGCGGRGRRRSSTVARTGAATANHARTEDSRRHRGRCMHVSSRQPPKPVFPRSIPRLPVRVHCTDFFGGNFSRNRPTGTLGHRWEKAGRSPNPFVHPKSRLRAGWGK